MRVESADVVGEDRTRPATLDPSDLQTQVACLRKVIDESSTSPRELEMFEYQSQGLSVVEVARVMGISHKRVRNSMSEVRRRARLSWAARTIVLMRFSG